MITHGALAFCIVLLCACPTVDLGDQPPDIGLCNPAKGFSYFQTEIVPNYLKLADTANGCGRDGACHNRAHGLAFDMTMANLASPANYRVAQQYLDCGQPRQSQLLTKPLAGEDGHGGGDLVTNGSTEMMVFLGWFQ